MLVRATGPESVTEVKGIFPMWFVGDLLLAKDVSISLEAQACTGLLECPNNMVADFPGVSDLRGSQKPSCFYG